MITAMVTSFNPVSVKLPSSRFLSKNTVSTNVLHSTPDKDKDDFGGAPSGGDSYEGDIDWDAEWKKVVETRGEDANRPGKEFYKNDIEKVINKTTKAANKQIKKVKIVQPPQVNIRSLAGDGKFWVAVLAIVSVGISLISAAGVSTYANSSENFYI